MTRNKNQTGDLIMSPIAGLATGGGKTQEHFADAKRGRGAADILPKLPQAHTAADLVEGGGSADLTAGSAGSYPLTESLGSGSLAAAGKTSSSANTAMGHLAAKEPKSHSSPKPLRKSQIASFRFSKTAKNVTEPSQAPPT